MGAKYIIGRSISAVENRLLSLRSLPLVSGVPFGRCWPYDVARYAGTRELGVIVDAGANVGQTALGLRRYFPNAEVHCFEPIPETFSLLEKVVGAYPRIHAHPLALSDETRELSMRADAFSETSAVTTSESGDIRRVKARTLDEFARATGIESIDILKVDVEGHEMPVIGGGARLLAGRRIQAVYVEVGMETGDLGHTHFSRVHAALEPHGFFFSGFYEAWRYPARYRMGFANALYWNPGYRR